MSTTINRRLASLEDHSRHNAGKPVFLWEGQPIPDGTDPARVVTVSWLGEPGIDVANRNLDGPCNMTFPTGFVWQGLEEDLDAIDAAKELK
jgi:hypothetical protein